MGAHRAPNVIAVLVTMAAFAGILTSPASAASGFQWSGTCRGASIVVDVAQEDIDPFVPDGFAIAADQADVIPFALQVFDCRDVVIAGTRRARVVVSEALVVLDRERSPALAGQPASDVDFYVIPTPSNSRLLKEKFRKVGLPHEVNPGMSVTWEEIAAIVEATGSAPGDFSVQVTATRTFPPREGSVCCTWQLGRKGLVRTRFELKDGTFDSGLGTLTAVPGSAMYEILGEQSHKDGVGVVRSFSFQGTVELRG